MTLWVNAWVAYLLVVRHATATVEDNKVATKVLDPTEYDEVVTTKGSKTIDAFSSKIIHAQMKTAFMGARLNVMTHALHDDEGPLPQGLMIQNAYTKKHNGSKDIAIVVRNSTVYPQTLKKKIPVARLVAANWVLEPQMQPGTIDMLDEAQGIQNQKLTVEQRHEKLSSFESSSLQLVESAYCSWWNTTIFSL